MAMRHIATLPACRARCRLARQGEEIMAVYEHTYKPYAGPLTPEWSRFLVIPAPRVSRRLRLEAVHRVLRVVLCVPAGDGDPDLLASQPDGDGDLPDRPARSRADQRVLLSVFRSRFQTGLAFLLTVLIGPPLISRDLANNALPLYLCRPLSRAEYVIGKMSVLMILISAITWIPGELLFLFQSYLEGAGWAAKESVDSGRDLCRELDLDSVARACCR